MASPSVSKANSTNPTTAPKQNTVVISSPTTSPKLLRYVPRKAIHNNHPPSSRPVNINADAIAHRASSNPADSGCSLGAAIETPATNNPPPTQGPPNPI